VFDQALAHVAEALLDHNVVVPLHALAYPVVEHALTKMGQGFGPQQFSDC